MSELTVDDFLEPYGVKGMKWGKRKEVKAAKKAARGEVRSEFQATHLNALSKDRRDGSRTLSKGKLAATALIDINTVGAATAITIAKSTGASNGKAAAVGLITGIPGSLAYCEIKVRQEANRRVGA